MSRNTRQGKNKCLEHLDFFPLDLDFSILFNIKIISWFSPKKKSKIILLHCTNLIKITTSPNKHYLKFEKLKCFGQTL